MTERTLILKDGEIGILLEALMCKREQVESAPEATINLALSLMGPIFEAGNVAPLYSCKADYVSHLKDLEKRLTEQMGPHVRKKAPPA